MKQARDASYLDSKREQLLMDFDRYVFNDLPTQLIHLGHKILVTRNEIWAEVRPLIEEMSDAELYAIRSSEDYIQACFKYAIFSHRWGAGEPSHSDIANNTSWTQVSKPGFLKLLNFCNEAEKYGCSYAWSDTCCIDKRSSAELEEAIRSMYRWYRNAEVCIVYLAKSSALVDFKTEPWFTRGWTLQELLAPRRIRFYGREWIPICPEAEKSDEEDDEDNKDQMGGMRTRFVMNDKEDESFLDAISQVTDIPDHDIQLFHPSCNRVSEKMRWAAKRTTTRIEDVAYSLIGIFDITIPIAYGEGNWAFHRLMEAIAQRCSDPSFFAWAGKSSYYSNALPISPACYTLDAQTAYALRLTHQQPSLRIGDPSFTITKLGLQVKLLVVPAHFVPSRGDAGEIVGCTLTPKWVTRWPRHTESIKISFRSHLPSHLPWPWSEFALGIVNYDRSQVEKNHGLLRTRNRYFCLWLSREQGMLAQWDKWSTDTLLVLYCEDEVEGRLETVCLLHSPSY